MNVKVILYVCTHNIISSEKLFNIELGEDKLVMVEEEERRSWKRRERGGGRTCNGRKGGDAELVIREGGRRSRLY